MQKRISGYKDFVVGILIAVLVPSISLLTILFAFGGSSATAFLLATDVMTPFVFLPVIVAVVAFLRYRGWISAGVIFVYFVTFGFMRFAGG